MERQQARTTRRPRTDAVRNRERVLEAAKVVFSAGGAEASLEAVARRAQVGIGTLYRHFPTREALLRIWLRAIVDFVATKKGMSAALALAAHGSSELSAYTSDRLTEAVSGLLERAIAAGEIRGDIGPEDLLRAMVGMCYMQDQPGWQTSVQRLVEVFVDGLSRAPATTHTR